MTTIEWTRGDDGVEGKAWNPIRGCSRVSPGCDNCYAMRMARRQDVPGGAYEGLTRIGARGVDWAGFARPAHAMLEEPLHWRKPRRVFVNSMSDLFHESLHDEDIAAVFGVMAACPQHTFQILTKRPKRAAVWFKAHAALGGASQAVRAALAARHAGVTDPRVNGCHGPEFAPWPLPNVHLGVCPKRSGNQAELFNDVKSADICTDPDCYKSKLDAHWRIASAEAKKAGKLVMTDKEARGTFDKWHDRPNHRYVELDDTTYTSRGSVKVRSLFGKENPAPVMLARNPHTGTIFELVPREAVNKAAKARAKTKGSSAKVDPAERARRERESLKAKGKDEIAKRTVAALADKLQALGADDPHDPTPGNNLADRILFDVLLDDIVDMGYDAVEYALERRGIEAPPKKRQKFGRSGTGPERVRQAAEGRDLGWMRGILLELALAERARYSTAADERRVAEICKRLKVDQKKIAESVADELKAQRQQEKVGAKKKSKADDVAERLANLPSAKRKTHRTKPARAKKAK